MLLECGYICYTCGRACEIDRIIMNIRCVLIIFSTSKIEKTELTVVVIILFAVNNVLQRQSLSYEA